MPRLLPPLPEWVDGRHGERAVWEALRDQLPDDVALLHSVWLVEEDREYEADLVVAWPGVGTCVVEVKGGRVERDDAGRWFQTKAGHAPRQVSNPMTQASDCRHAGETVRDVVTRAMTRPYSCRFDPVVTAQDSGMFIGLVRLERASLALAAPSPNDFVEEFL